MTDKQNFLDNLSAALYERNISEADIRPYIEQFDHFYDRMVSDTSGTQNLLENIESIADNIAAQISDRYDDINRFAERTMTVDAVKADGEDETPEFDVEATMTTDISELTVMSEEYEPIVPEDEDGYLAEQELDMPGEREYTGESTRLPDYDVKEDIPNSKMFWILFAISLPITFPLFLCIVGAFAGVWLGLAGVLAATVAALVGIVAAGAAISLIGIIYGVIQLFVSMPVGLYEIGIGVIVAGAVMLIGILIYNFAVRLIPLLMRLWWKLFLYVLEQLKRLFNHLRRESVKL